MRIALVYSLKCTWTTPNKLLNNSGLAIYMTFIWPKLQVDASWKTCVNSIQCWTDNIRYYTRIFWADAGSENYLNSRTFSKLSHLYVFSIMFWLTYQVTIPGICDNIYLIKIWHNFLRNSFFSLFNSLVK